MPLNKKKKCKVGFKQVGAVCQPIKVGALNTAIAASLGGILGGVAVKAFTDDKVSDNQKDKNEFHQVIPSSISGIAGGTANQKDKNEFYQVIASSLSGIAGGTAAKLLTGNELAAISASGALGGIAAGGSANDLYNAEKLLRGANIGIGSYKLANFLREGYLASRRKSSSGINSKTTTELSTLEVEDTEPSFIPNDIQDDTRKITPSKETGYKALPYSDYKDLQDEGAPIIDEDYKALPYSVPLISGNDYKALPAKSMPTLQKEQEIADLQKQYDDAKTQLDFMLRYGDRVFKGNISQKDEEVIRELGYTGKPLSKLTRNDIEQKIADMNRIKKQLEDITKDDDIKQITPKPTDKISYEELYTPLTEQEAKRADRIFTPPDWMAMQMPNNPLSIPNSEFYKDYRRLKRNGNAQNLTPLEAKAIRAYSAGGYVGINALLRNKMINTNTANARNHRIAARLVAQGLEKMPRHEGFVYRGTDLSREELARYEFGTKHTLNGFTSATTDQSVAYEYATKPFLSKSSFYSEKAQQQGITTTGDRVKVFFEMKVKNGRNIQGIASKKQENEILLPHGWTGEVVRYEYRPKIGYVISMVETDVKKKTSKGDRTDTAYRTDGKRCGKGFISIGKQCLKKTADGKIVYQGKEFAGFNQPRKSDRKGKKRMVLAKKGKEVKLLHYGSTGYRHNYSNDAKRNYLQRSAGIRDKHGKLTKNDIFSPNYWARRDLWNTRLPADGRSKYDIGE